MIRKNSEYPLQPPRERGTGRAFVFALVMHALLGFFLYHGIQWQNSTPEGAEAELWTEVPDYGDPASRSRRRPCRCAPAPPVRGRTGRHRAAGKEAPATGSGSRRRSWLNSSVSRSCRRSRKPKRNVSSNWRPTRRRSSPRRRPRQAKQKQQQQATAGRQAEAAAIGRPAKAAAVEGTAAGSSRSKPRLKRRRRPTRRKRRRPRRKADAAAQAKKARCGTSRASRADAGPGDRRHRLDDRRWARQRAARAAARVARRHRRGTRTRCVVRCARTSRGAAKRAVWRPWSPCAVRRRAPCWAQRFRAAAATQQWDDAALRAVQRSDPMPLDINGKTPTSFLITLRPAG